MSEITKTCPVCNGTGEVATSDYYNNTAVDCKVTCRTCGGTGRVILESTRNCSVCGVEGLFHWQCPNCESEYWICPNCRRAESSWIPH